ncbi:putative Alpha/Beta hydrolase protein [Seiridium cardinale]|uniref:Alpha/Beta hydrolase protein n=1 Tax=Seiridium cardinale TaxID=138064 RepID=A0ABR2XH01_9PEZI
MAGIWRWLKLRAVVYLFRFISNFRLRQVAKQDLLLAGDIQPRRVYIPSRDPRRDIIGDLYYPPDLSSSSSPNKRPILVNWHGSGFIIPSLGNDRAFCAQVARETGIIVLDADYRKAPENPFPAAINDVEDTLKWISTRPDEFDASKVAVSGFSAGGNLALVASSSLRQGLDDAGINIVAVAALYPVTDLSLDPVAKKVPNPVRPMPAVFAVIWEDCYAPDASQRSDPRISPSLAATASFPETVAIITAEGDTLSPEAIALALALEKTDKTVVNKTMPGMPHGFDKGCTKGTKEWDQREIAYYLVIHSLREAFKL